MCVACGCDVVFCVGDGVVWPCLVLLVLALVCVIVLVVWLASCVSAPVYMCVCSYVRCGLVIVCAGVVL